MKKRIFIFILLIVGTRGPMAAAGPDGAWPWFQDMALLGEPSPALQGFLAQSRQRGASPEFVRQVVGEAQSLKFHNLPVEPYLLKANEGLAKKISPAHITPALGQTRRRTEVAGRLVDQALLGSGHPPSQQERFQAIRDFQGALQGGVPPEELARLREKKRSLQEIDREARALAATLEAKGSTEQVTKSPGKPSEKSKENSDKNKKKDKINNKSNDLKSNSSSHGSRDHGVVEKPVGGGLNHGKAKGK